MVDDITPGMPDTGTGQGAYPWPPFPRVSSSQPFTMRDGMSYLEILEKLRHGLEIIQKEWERYLKQVTQWGMDTEKAWQKFQEQYHTDFENLRDELIQLIHDASQSDNVMVWSSAYGRMVPLQQALDDIYDADRVHGLFVMDFDSLNLTPAQFDALKVEPRMFDMHSVHLVNAVKGDITADDILWLNPQQPTTPTEQQLAKIFLRLNPSANAFSNGN